MTFAALFVRCRCVLLLAGAGLGACISKPVGDAPDAATTSVATSTAALQPTPATATAIAPRPYDCRADYRCEFYGACTAIGPQGQSCGATSEEDCRRSKGCPDHGMCALPEGAVSCSPCSDEDCRRSTACSVEGQCKRKEAACVAVTDADCAASAGCKAGRLCFFDGIKACSNERGSALRPERECKARGGQWAGTESGRGRITGCILPTKDKGKPCNDSKDCEGPCVHYKCWESSDYRGCGFIREGKEICVD